MKWIARLFGFTTALVIGIFTASVFQFSEHKLVRSVPTPSERGLSVEPTDIKIMYDGWERDQDGAYLKFVIYNGLDRPISYLGYSPKYAPIAVSTNGEVERTWDCVNGTILFMIQPGRAAELFVTRDDFESRPRRTDMVSVEYGLFTTPHGETELHRSEPFFLPEEFRRSIKIAR